MALPGQLGCGSYTARIVTRGGSMLIAEIPATKLKWSRQLDDTSQADLETDQRATIACCAQLGVLRQWRHEYSVMRDGVEVWVGPLAGQPKYAYQGAQLKARDLSAWLDKRFIHNTISYVNADLATIFEAYVRDAMSPDPTPGLAVTASPCGVRGTRSVDAADYKHAGPEIRELSQSGIDWTMIGRVMLAGGLVVPSTPVATLTDEHFVDPPDVEEDGMAQANRWAVLGAQAHDAVTGQFTSGFAFTGVAESVADANEDGLLEDRVQIDQVKDTQSAYAAAVGRLALTRTTIPIISGGTLTPSAPITIDQLVPGALVNVLLQNTCRPVSGQYRLQTVDVTVAPDEQVSITLQPMGTL